MVREIVVAFGKIATCFSKRLYYVPHTYEVYSTSVTMLRGSVKGGDKINTETHLEIKRKYSGS